MSQDYWFLEGEVGEGVTDETVKWLLDNSTWEDDMLIPP